MKKESLNNIKEIFSRETGVVLRPARRKLLPTLLAAVLMVCMMTVTAFAGDIFSSLKGDDLSLRGEYAGEGIVKIHVENRSDKPLYFQKQFRLCLWSTGEDVPRISEDYSMSGTEFEPHSAGVMTIDLSEAYDVAELEQPLRDDHYYFYLTNNNFIFGQDWICSISFSPVSYSESRSGYSSYPDDGMLESVEAELAFYYESFYPWPSEEAIELHDSYIAACERLFDGSGLMPVPPVKPLVGSTWVGKNAPETTWAGLYLKESDPQLGYYETMFDIDRKFLAGSMDMALVLEAYLPSGKNSSEFVGVPLLYIYTYEKAACKPESCILVHGHMLRFSEIEEHKVFDDGEYVCYELSDFVYSNHRDYYEKLCTLDDRIPREYEQIETLRCYALENLPELLARHEQN